MFVACAERWKLCRQAIKFQLLVYTPFQIIVLTNLSQVHFHKTPSHQNQSLLIIPRHTSSQFSSSFTKSRNFLPNEVMNCQTIAYINLKFIYKNICTYAYSRPIYLQGCIVTRDRILCNYIDLFCCRVCGYKIAEISTN